MQNESSGGLLPIIQQIVGNYMKASSLTDLVFGTVVSVDPLSIKVVETMLELPREAIILTDSVVEKRITINPHLHAISTLSHTHSYQDDNGNGVSSKTTGEALSGSYNTQNTSLVGSMSVNGEDVSQDGKEENEIIIQRGLEVDDSVVMLRVSGGQRFLVLSKTYPAEQL